MVLAIAIAGRILRNLRIQLGQNGKAAVTEQFAPDTMVDTIENVYNEFINK